MAPPRLAPLKVRRDAAGGVRIAGAPDRSPLVARAGTALTELTRRAAADGARPVDVQPVVQVSDAGRYRAWRLNRERIWRAQGDAWGTGTWPEAIAPDHLAAVLLPLAPAAAANPGDPASHLVAEPLFSTGTRADGAGAEDMALGLIAQWLRLAVAGPALLVAAPVLELVGDRTTNGRRTLDLGLRWPMAGTGRHAA